MALAVLVLIVGAVGWFPLSLFQPLKGDGEGDGGRAHPAGAGVGEIADLLERSGVISSAFFFQARARSPAAATTSRPGRFTLKRGMSHGAAMDALAEGPPRRRGPGDRARGPVAPRGRPDRGQPLRGDYLSATRARPLLNPRRYGAPRARDLEGFLFPSTYEFKQGSRTDRAGAEQLAQFKREFAKVDLALRQAHAT